MRSTSVLLILTGLVLCDGNCAEAQLFGQRSLGRSRVQSPATRGGATATPGVVTGTRRFIRDQRGSNTFVGADRSDVDGFVGSTAGRTQGAVVSSTVGLTEPPTPRVNDVMQAPPRNGPYAARITLGPGFVLPQNSKTAPVVRSLIPPRRSQVPYGQRPGGQSASPLDSIRVSVQGRTATLVGEVASVHDRQVAELLASFEPGVESIENQIRVAGQVPALPLTTPNR